MLLHITSDVQSFTLEMVKQSISLENSCFGYNLCPFLLAIFPIWGDWKFSFTIKFQRTFSTKFFKIPLNIKHAFITCLDLFNLRSKPAYLALIWKCGIEAKLFNCWKCSIKVVFHILSYLFILYLQVYPYSFHSRSTIWTVTDVKCLISRLLFHVVYI